MEKIERFETSQGTPFFRIPIEAFPGLWTYAYLVMPDGYNVLVDTGSGVGEAEDQLLEGILESGKSVRGNAFSPKDISHVLITHGHIDHFGGLSSLNTHTDALAGVHELDRRNITRFLERRTINLHFLNEYLIKAGVNGNKLESMLDFYRYTLRLFDSAEVDFGFEQIDMQLGPFRFLHVPGHSGGHVVIGIEDVLFCGDHVLMDITPHQAPEELSAWCGLNHYLRSLDLLDSWAGDVQFAFGGHKQFITDLHARIAEIKQMHEDRLHKVLLFFGTPNTIDALSEHLFGSANGFDGLLAIEEAGAHVEYLYQRGLLRINNFDQLIRDSKPITYEYQSTIPDS